MCLLHSVRHVCCLTINAFYTFYLSSNSRHSKGLLLQAVGVQYEYEVRGLRDTLTFVAGPEVGPSARFSFVVYGDMGESDHPRAKAPG